MRSFGVAVRRWRVESPLASLGDAARVGNRASWTFGRIPRRPSRCRSRQASMLSSHGCSIASGAGFRRGARHAQCRRRAAAGVLRRMLVQSWPDFGQSGAISTVFGQIRPDFDDFGLDSARFWRLRPKSARFWQIGSEYRQSWPRFGQNWSMSTEFDPMFVEIGPDLIDALRFRPSLA